MWKHNGMSSRCISKEEILIFFYNLANLCKFLGIKFNIAMLYLADEMFKNRHKTFKVTIGKPIPWQTFDKSRSATEWADYVRELVYKL